VAREGGPGRRTLKAEGAPEQGVALVIVMMTITLLAGLAGSLALATITETAVAANYREATDVLYAAEAAVEFVLQEIGPVEDWAELLEAPGQSAFVDGAPGGSRQVAGASVDLAQATLDVSALATPPRGAVHLPSVLHAFGWFSDLVPGAAARSRAYVAVWLADRSPAPREDAAPPAALSVVGQAFGGRGARRAVEAIVEKTDTSAVRVLAWRELR
jgi:hypothetical protein